jgi:hypothetical protein
VKRQDSMRVSRTLLAIAFARAPGQLPREEEP